MCYFFWKCERDRGFYISVVHYQHTKQVKRQLVVLFRFIQYFLVDSQCKTHCDDVIFIQVLGTVTESSIATSKWWTQLAGTIVSTALYSRDNKDSGIFDTTAISTLLKTCEALLSGIERSSWRGPLADKCCPKMSNAMTTPTHSPLESRYNVVLCWGWVEVVNVIDINF